MPGQHGFRCKDMQASQFDARVWMSGCKPAVDSKAGL